MNQLMYLTLLTHFFFVAISVYYLLFFPHLSCPWSLCRVYVFVCLCNDSPFIGFLPYCRQVKRFAAAVVMATAGPVLFGIGSSPEPYQQHHQRYDSQQVNSFSTVVLHALQHRDYSMQCNSRISQQNQQLLAVFQIARSVCLNF